MCRRSRAASGPSLPRRRRPRPPPSPPRDRSRPVRPRSSSGGPCAVSRPRTRPLELLERGRRIDRRQDDQVTIGVPRRAAQDRLFEARLDEPPASLTRLARRDRGWLGLHLPLDGLCQTREYDVGSLFIGPDQLALKPKALRTSEDEHRPWPEAASENRPFPSAFTVVSSGPSPRWKTSTPATGLPCRSTTLPPIVRKVPKVKGWSSFVLPQASPSPTARHPSRDRGRRAGTSTRSPGPRRQERAVGSSDGRGIREIDPVRERPGGASVQTSTDCPATGWPR